LQAAVDTALFDFGWEDADKLREAAEDEAREESNQDFDNIFCWGDKLRNVSRVLRNIFDPDDPAKQRNLGLAQISVKPLLALAARIDQLAVEGLRICQEALQKADAELEAENSDFDTDSAEDDNADADAGILNMEQGGEEETDGGGGDDQEGQENVGEGAEDDSGEDETADEGEEGEEEEEGEENEQMEEEEEGEEEEVDGDAEMVGASSDSEDGGGGDSTP
jgi:hypothetical protein